MFFGGFTTPPPARRRERWSSLLYHITHLLMDISCWKIQHALLEALVLLLQFNLHASKKVGRSPKLRIREVVVALPTSQENSKSIWRKKSKRVQIFSWPFTKGWDFAEMEKKLQLSLNIGVFVVKLFFSKSYKSGRGGRKCHIIFWQVTRHHLKGAKLGMKPAISMHERFFVAHRAVY